MDHPPLLGTRDHCVHPYTTVLNPTAAGQRRDLIIRPMSQKCGAKYENTGEQRCDPRQAELTDDLLELDLKIRVSQRPDCW